MGAGQVKLQRLFHLRVILVHNIGNRLRLPPFPQPLAKAHIFKVIVFSDKQKPAIPLMGQMPGHPFPRFCVVYIYGIQTVGLTCHGYNRHIQFFYIPLPYFTGFTHGDGKHAVNPVAAHNIQIFPLAVRIVIAVE